MGHAYTPGLRVTDDAVIRKKRILPIQGDLRDFDTVSRVLYETRPEGIVHLGEQPSAP